MAQKKKAEVKITLVKSGIGRPAKHKTVLAGLGLRKLNASVVRVDSPQLRGMINKVSHLLKVETL